MLKFIINDTANDIAVLQSTASGFHIRYGLQSWPCQSLEDAIENYTKCLRHALAAHGIAD